MPPEWKPFYYYHYDTWYFILTHNDWLSLEPSVRDMIRSYQKRDKEHEGYAAFGHKSIMFFGNLLSNWISKQTNK